MIYTILSSGAAYVALIFLVAICIYAISINDNRLDELRLNEKLLQQNAERIAGFGSSIVSNPNIANTNPDLTNNFTELANEAKALTGTIHDINYKRFYGDKEARDKLRDPNQKRARRWADHFHARSDTTNVMIIGMSACAIGVFVARLYAATKIRNQHIPTLLEIFSSLTVFDVSLGLLAGLVATFAIKSGLSFLSKTPLSTVDASNPYGIALVTAIVGLFLDKFFAWLERSTSSLG